MRLEMRCGPSSESNRSPWIFPVFLPHAGCPHRCIFCDQHRITDAQDRLSTSEQLQVSIQAALRQAIDPSRKREIAFFGGNFLGLPLGTIRSLLDATLPFQHRGLIQGIRCSTRPDTVSDSILHTTKAMGLTTVELGAQSMSDEVLEASQRGHRVSDTIQAVERLQQAGMTVGLQLMVGLPEDSPQTALTSAEMAASLKPDFVRIYPTLVLSGTSLAEQFQAGKYRPMTLEAAVSTVAEMTAVFERFHIPVIRVGLQASETLSTTDAILAGPYHPAFGHLVAARKFRNRLVSELDPCAAFDQHLLIRVHPRDVPQVRGDRNETMHFLKQRYGLREVAVCPDTGIERNRFEIHLQRHTENCFEFLTNGSTQI